MSRCSSRPLNVTLAQIFPLPHTIILFLLFLCEFITCFASVQPPDTLKVKKNFILNGYSQFGSVMATNPFLKPTDPILDRDYDFLALSFQIQKQTTGKSIWEKNYGYPSYGVGIYSATFFNTRKLGTPIAAYVLFKAPFKRWNRLSFNFEGGFGLTFNWEGFNPSENSYNIAMGADQSVFIDLGTSLTYALNSFFDLGLGYSFTHFSNGALKSPNYGLNTFAPKISLNYHPNRFVPPAVKETLPAFRQKTYLDFSLYGGVKNVLYMGSESDSIANYQGAYYSVYGFNTLLSRQVTYKSKIGIGLSLSYDGSNNSAIFVKSMKPEAGKGSWGNNLNLSIYPSYELVIHHLSVVVQPGFYLFRKTTVNNKPPTYQRLGLHYQLSKRIFAGICLRAYNYHVSDFIEWSAGYRINLSSE